MSHPKKVFISYARNDEDAMYELDKYLGPLEQNGTIRIWTDRQILPGQLWKNEILKELQSADLILLLVSANFLDSDFIHEEEIPRAFQRMNEHGKHVVPIILNYCMWDYTALKDLQAIPKDGRPIADFPNPAQAWSEVSRGILELLREDSSASSVGRTSVLGASKVDLPVSAAIRIDKHKILMLTANPSGQAILNLDKEYARIAHKLQNKPEWFDLTHQKAVDRTGFKEFTEKVRPHILHFSGHGEAGKQYGGLVLQNEDRNDSELLSAKALSTLFKYFTKTEGIAFNAVVLNACFSADQAEAIAQYVPYVIGTTIGIDDGYAIAFSTGFYFKLAENNADYEKAFESGRMEAVMAGADEADFVLYKNGKQLTL